MPMPLQKSAQSESVWARLSPSSERRGKTATLLAPSHNSQILILYGSTNPAMMIEWYLYGRHGLSLPRTRSHNTFAGKRKWQLQAERSLLRLLWWLDSPSGPRLPNFRGSEITLRHTTVGRTPLDEWSTSRTDLYLTKHNNHKRQPFMSLAIFEPTNPASVRPQTHVWDSVATGIGQMLCTSNINLRQMSGV